MKLFIGISLDPSLRDYIDIKKEKISSSITTGKLTDKRNFHITLKFLGNVDDENFKNIVTELKKIEYENNEFIIYLDKLGEFQKRNKSILWIGLKESSEIKNLFSNLDEKMNKLNFTKDDRPYVPHITLGRGIRYKTDFKDLESEIHIKNECIHVKTITLYESKQVNNKLSYVPIEVIELGKKTNK